MSATEMLRWSAKDWERFSFAAAPQNITKRIHDTEDLMRRLATLKQRLLKLESQRLVQVARGEWPPK